VHAGALGVFFQTNAQPTGGGLFPTTNIVLRPVYTLALEAGYFVTPNIAIALSTGIPPLVSFKATGFPGTPLFGSNLLGTVRAGPAIALVQYHFTQFGALQPYICGKKAFLSTDAQGFTIPANTPVRTHVTLDPWLVSAGITFKY